jgi:hypothetical protein
VTNPKAARTLTPRIGDRLNGHHAQDFGTVSAFALQLRAALQTVIASLAASVE